MTEITQDQLQEMKDRIYALQLLVLAHIAAADADDRSIGDGTFAIALSQIDSLVANHRELVAIRLKGMIESIKQLRD